MALAGIKVLEIAGLAPVPFCGMIMADFGATVVRVDRVGGETSASGNDLLARGKKSVCLDLKDPQSIEVLKKIIPKFDVLLEPFRPGVMERLGLGPEELLKLNPRLVYARLTGFGQRKGPLQLLAGHDINYLATSGVLSMFQRAGEKPLFPGNVLGDFAAGSLSCAFGIVAALFERNQSGRGQVVDAAIVDGTVYLSTFLYNAAKTPIWDQPPGHNVLDSGSPNYEVYETRDGKYMAVGALEPQFYALLLKGLGFPASDLPPILDRSQWPTLKLAFETRFKEKTRDEWCAIFNGTDACVTPVLSFSEIDPKYVAQDGSGPQPAPILSRTPAYAGNSVPSAGEHTEQVLTELGLDKSDIASIRSGRAKL